MLNELLSRYPQLNTCVDEIESAKDKIITCYQSGSKLLLCGNGGSAADCDHIVGELVKGFLKRRPIDEDKKAKMLSLCPELSPCILNKLQGGLPAVSLPSFAGLNSAFCNDVDPELIYAQSVLALAKKGDILIALSTSGNSKNVVAAALLAKSLGIKVIALTGKSGGKLRHIADICICAPETETYKVQELHLPIYHYLCAQTEAYFFEK